MADILDSIDDLMDDEEFESSVSLDEALEINEGSGDSDLDAALGELDEVFAEEGLAEIVNDASYDIEVLMTEADAKAITNAIKSASNAVFAMLEKAHRGKAYRALGYATWADYVKTEFDMSTQRSYQLLDLAKAINMIEEATPEGTSVILTEAQARDIKRELPTITERIEEETRELPPEDAGDAVNRIIEEAREQQKADAEAVAIREKSIEEAREEGRRAGIEAVADQMLEADSMSKMTDGADDGFLEVQVAGEGGLDPEDTIALFNFTNVLIAFEGLPAPDDFVNVIQDTNFDDTFDQVEEAASYMNRLLTLMEVRRDERTN